MKKGDRVRLVPLFDQPEAFGTVLEVQRNGMVTVELDEEHRDGEHPDGLCEVEAEFLEVK